jgi:RNA-splicing ligase RtcB
MPSPIPREPEVVEATQRAGLARRVAKLLPIVTIKG